MGLGGSEVRLGLTPRHSVSKSLVLWTEVGLDFTVAGESLCEVSCAVRVRAGPPPSGPMSVGVGRRGLDRVKPPLGPTRRPTSET